MAKKTKKAVPKSGQQGLQNAVEISEECLLGALVKAYQQAVEAENREVESISMDDVARILGMEEADGNLKNRIGELLNDYWRLGLELGDASSSVTPIPGIHWFENSKMYERLVHSRRKVLSNLFVNVANQRIEDRISAYKLLVDAGSTTFRCLLHPRFTLPSDDNEESGIVTNNLFVAQWLQKKVTLIEGKWDLETGAIVDTERPSKHLKTDRKRPTVGIMSWHFVKATDDDVVFYTKHEKEKDMKEATLNVTESLVFMLVDKEKFVEKGEKQPPNRAPEYSLKKDLLKTQGAEHRRNYKIAEDREIYLVTDYDKMTPELERVMKIFKSKDVSDLRVYLVSECDAANTRPQ